jgi:hypothetical protein
LRRAHYPPDRNLVPAHLTLFLHLPPSLLPELKDRLRAECQGSAPSARASSVANLEHGVAILIDSPELKHMRERLADALATLLMPQDAANWWPHVTIQNKVQPTAASALHNALAADFTPRPIGIAGLAISAYLGGPWELLARYRFNRPARFRRS